ncbi:unannotated protein [freshwater metagenome]|uniref:Unannotated protein n=1 Tax=freshwater metagenome TaxID=449393 RepID=A0A6J7ERX3_9ZZZZ|nr:DUF1003 domain-containing protein [Actinomycetota bacterium]
MTRRSDLSTPRQRRRFGLHYDPDAFGQFSETIARTLGTARFLVWQSGIIVLWFAYNFVVPNSAKFDNPTQGWVRLTMVLSLQAAYAAPLILLAQNRQEQRDRSELDLDRKVTERTQADTEFLAREISSVRLALADIVTTEDLRDHLERLTDAVERMAQRLDLIEVQATKVIALDQPRDE